VRRASHCGSKQQERLHAAITLLLSPHRYISDVVLCAHSVRGEPRIQRNASGDVATLTPKPKNQVTPIMQRLTASNLTEEVKESLNETIFQSN